MKRILALKECHGFPATAISLNETGTMIASGSADGTVMVARVSSGSLRPIPFFALLIAAILAALIAILLSRTGDVQQEL